MFNRSSVMNSLGLDVNKVADLIGSRFVTSGNSLSVLKLHKLLYYVEAWHLVFFNTMLFDEDFEAWVHGPVCRKIFNRFKSSKFMYSPITSDDLSLVQASDIQNYQDVIYHIENVLNTYGNLTGPQLEELTHMEEPWRKARGNLAPNQPCENIISKEFMRNYYKQQLPSS